MMTTSTLRQVLNYFEEATGPLSLSTIAYELNVSTAQVESMIQYWIRKGRIHQSAMPDNCGSCGSSGDCVFVMDMPVTYELTSHENVIPLQEIGLPCGTNCGCS